MLISQSTREVEKISMVEACRGMENIACTRCTEEINTWYREEIRLLLLWEFAVAIGVCCGDSCVKKNQSAAAELNRRGSVQRMGMAHRA
jgi:hypothetical protein